MPRDGDAAFSITEGGSKLPPDWHFENPCLLQGKVVPDRQFIVDQWLGRGHVTINYGDGGVGKTLLAQQLMTSTTVSKPWCGLAVTPCRSIGLFCEDDEDELHRRQDAINRAYDIQFSDLSQMTWASGVGQDNTLVTFDDDGCAIPTVAFELLLRQAKESQADLVVIDTAADTFGGNENNRREVRQYVGFTLGKLARELNAAVLLNAHPSRSGLSPTGDIDGGSTAWSNTARARWSLTRPKPDADADGDTSERILTRRKANYASIGDTIKLRWQNGVLVPVNALIGLSAMAAAADADCVFVGLVRKSDAENRPVSDNSHAGNYAPKLFASRPDRQGFTKREFEAAMQRLFASGRIIMQPYGRPSDLRHRITAVSQP